MFKKMNSNIDMTIGTPWKCIVSFTLPMLLGNIAQQLYATVDSIVVGRYVGDNALAAVGSTLPVVNMLLVLFVGIASGVTIMVSQYLGARDRESLSKTIGTSITVTFLSCVCLIIFALPFIRPALKMLKTPDAILKDSGDYLTIWLVGIFSLGFFNVLSGAIRGMGDSFTPLLFVIASAILNTFLDIYFVAKLGWGVKGVAYATVISQYLSAALCLIRLTRMRECFSFKIKYLKPVKEYVKTIIRLGIPSGITQMIFASAQVFVQSLTNSFGEQFIAANVIIMRVDGFAMMPNLSFGVAMSTYAGQNVGAGLYDRVTKGAKQGTYLAVGTSAFITVLILLFGKNLMGIFTETKELVDLSYYLMRFLAVGYIAFAVTQSLSGTMRGAGDTVSPMWISIITTVVFRVPIAYGISYLTRTPELPYGRCECIHIALLFAWVLGSLLTTIFYKRGKWKEKAITTNKA